MDASYQLDILRELREAVGLTQDEMAGLCGLQGQLRRQTAGAWERGDIIPSRARRTRFMGYLWDALKLRSDPPRFETVWEVLMVEWGWEAISDKEWAALTTQARPRRESEFEQKLEEIEATLNKIQATTTQTLSTPAEMVTDATSAKRGDTTDNVYPPSERKAFDAILYTQPGNIKRPAILFGREALFNHAYKQLEQYKHLLLTGFGGTGKSALAATLAEQWIKDRQGAVLWLVADNGDVDTILEAMMSPFDYQQELAQKRGDAKINFVQRVLIAEHVAMVVLDNVEQMLILAQIRKVIPDRTALLVTSRYDAAHMDDSLKVHDLESSAAQALLAHHAQNTRFAHATYQDDPATDELCARLSYHALGIVIAGGWLKQSRRPAVDLLRRLDAANLTPLTIEMPPAARQRGQATVELVLEQTLRGLSPHARTLFSAWGTLAHAQATAELLCFYVEMTPLAVENALDELVAWNFAERAGSNLYSVHEMIHQYARHLWQIGDPVVAALPQIDVVITRYVAAYAQDFASLHHNLSNVLVTAEVVDDAKRLEILEPLVMYGFLDAYGYRLVVVALLDRTLSYLRASAHGQLNEEQNARLHFFLSKRGNASFDRGEYADAAKAYRAALEVAPNEGRLIKLTALVGKALAFAGADEESKDYFAEAHERIVDDDVLRSFVLEQEAHVAGYKGDYLMAGRVATEQVTINRRLIQSSIDPETDAENYDALFRSLINLGTAELRSGQGTWEHSLVIHQEAMALAEKYNHQDWKAHASWALAEDYHMLGSRTHAAYYLRAAQALYQEQEKRRDEQEVIAFARQHYYTEIEG